MSELWDVYTKDRKRTVKTYPIGTLKQYKYVVTLSFYEGKILLSRHKDRTTWETQGGHVEAGETTFEAAKRELYEESGAVDYDIVPLCDYWAGTEDESKGAYGRSFARRSGSWMQFRRARWRKCKRLIHCRTILLTRRSRQIYLPI